MLRISIIGSGYVGSNVGKGFSILGNKVLFYDIDKSKLIELRENGFNITNDLQTALNESDISFICVPTPTIDDKIDLNYILSVTRDIGKFLKDKNRYHIIVIKSTVIPTTTEKEIIPLLEKISGKKVSRDIGVCVNPEFITQIHHTWTENSSFARDFFSENMIVIGESDKSSGDILEELYRPMKIPIFRFELTEAEFLKYVANCALSSKLSYWNEIFLIGRKLGFDHEKIRQIANTVGMDTRIGKYGTVLGKAFGGKCLPKDLKAFLTFVKENYDFDPVLLRGVDQINRYMAERYGVRE